MSFNVWTDILSSIEPIPVVLHHDKETVTMGKVVCFANITNCTPEQLLNGLKGSVLGANSLVISKPIEDSLTVMEHLTVEQLAEAMMELGEKEDTPLSQMTREEMDLSVFAAQGDTEAHQEAFGALMIASLKDVLEAMATGTSKGCCVVHRPDLDVNIIFLANRGLFSTSKRAISLARTHTKRRIAQQAKAEAKAAKEAKRLALRNKKKASKRANKVSKRKVIISSSESSDSDVFSGSSDVSTVYGGGCSDSEDEFAVKKSVSFKGFESAGSSEAELVPSADSAAEETKEHEPDSDSSPQRPRKVAKSSKRNRKATKSRPSKTKKPARHSKKSKKLSSSDDSSSYESSDDQSSSPPPSKEQVGMLSNFSPFLVNTTWFYLLIGL